MYIGQRVFIKYEGELKEGNVEEIGMEDIDIKLDCGLIIKRKFWEVRKVEIKDE
jgi:hypothetical protein